MSDIKSITLSRAVFNVLCTWLGEVPLIRFEARARTRFLKLASSKIDEVESARLEILGRYAEKNEDGTLKKNDKGLSVFTGTNEDEANKEFRAYMDEMMTLDVLPGNHEDIETVKMIFTDRLEKKMNAVESAVYDTIVTELERVCGTS